MEKHVRKQAPVYLTRCTVPDSHWRFYFARWFVIRRGVALRQVETAQVDRSPTVASCNLKEDIKSVCFVREYVN